MSRYVRQREEMLFWDKLRRRLRRVALGVCEGTQVSPWMDADDIAGDAVIVAMEFYDTRIGRRELTKEEHESLREEAYWYARKALKNGFVTQLRRRNVHIKTMEDQGRRMLLQLWSGDLRREPSPEDNAIATDLATRIADTAKLTESDVYMRIAQTIVDVANEGVTNIDAESLAELSDASANRRRDFANMLARRLGLSVKGSKEDAE